MIRHINIFQVARLVREVEEVGEVEDELVQEISQAEADAEQQKKSGFSISRKAMVRRQAAPTGTPGYCSSTGRKRRQETMQAACVIHGGSSSNTKPATIGMVETIETRSKEEDIVEAVRKTTKLKGRYYLSYSRKIW